MPQRLARLESIDLLRGIVMILMALDHTRDFFGAGGSPTNLATTTFFLFMTRWVTNICAPVFFLLTGVGARLALRGKTKAELSRFPFTRGLWLIFLEVVVLRCLAWQFNFDYRFTMLFVLWALGWSMIALAALIHWPNWMVAAFGLGMIVTHNLTDGLAPASFGKLAWLWTILHVPGFLSDRVFVAYPLVPWIGVTAVGYAMGERQRGFLLRAGLWCTAGFFVLRALNVYGDPVRWSVQKSTLFTGLSFLNTTKYPPSLLFLSMTLGPALLLPAVFSGRTPTALRPVLVFGRVPLFYFCTHAALIHLLAVGVCLLKYGGAHWMFESPTVARYPITPPPGWGFSLPVVYGIWMLVVVALYPACRWFSDLKRRNTSPLLSYL